MTCDRLFYFREWWKSRSNNIQQLLSVSVVRWWLNIARYLPNNAQQWETWIEWTNNTVCVPMKLYSSATQDQQRQHVISWLTLLTTQTTSAKCRVTIHHNDTIHRSITFLPVTIKLQCLQFNQLQSSYNFLIILKQPLVHVFCKIW